MGRPDQELIGRTIAGKFVVEALIGSGAMGAVYRARQVALEKTVAIKVLHREHADDATFAARFQREARAASRLNHPNSMQVIDYGEEPDGTLYIAMEYLDGRSLHRVLRDDGPLPPARIADILMQVLAAVAVAHDMNVVHRDLKPDNIVVLSGTDDDGHPRDIVKVCDFGIAKITDPRAYSGERESRAPVTTAGFLVGTPEYMSPEQGRGDKLDARSDLYSIGVILFEMLTGRVPFEAENAIGVVLKHVTEDPPRPSKLAPGVDPGLEAICLRAMRKPREARYQSAREMRADLRASLGLPAPMASSPELPRDPGRAHAPDPGTAATVALRAPALAAPRVEDTPAKPTLAGTTASVPGAGRRRTTLVAIVAASAMALGMTLIALSTSRRSGPEVGVGRAVAPPAETTLVPEPQAGGDLPPLENLAPAGSGASLVAPRGSHTPAGRGAPSASAAPAASAVPSSAASASPAAQAPSAPPASPPAPPPAVAPDPDFDPSRAYVEVGIINAQGVRERAVRAALHNIGFAGCYQRALRTQGARAAGTATLDLSIDETGVTRSAIARGAEFLPGLTRCVQGAAAGATLLRSQVDPGGGTAEVTLAFRAP